MLLNLLHLSYFNRAETAEEKKFPLDPQFQSVTWGSSGQQQCEDKLFALWWTKKQEARAETTAFNFPRLVPAEPLPAATARLHSLSKQGCPLEKHSDLELRIHDTDHGQTAVTAN